MKLTQYGITYERPAEEHLEMLRQWRNAPGIVQHMDRKEYITPEMQHNWFRSVNNTSNYYFIIYPGVTPAGLVHCKNINYDEASGEVGIFISDPAYMRSKVFLYASMTILNFAFDHLKLRQVTVKVMETNTMFLSIIARLNFKPVHISETRPKAHTFILSVAAYKELFEKYAVITRMLSKEDGHLNVE